MLFIDQRQVCGVLKMLFLIISNANINFQAQNLQQRFYITKIYI